MWTVDGRQYIVCRVDTGAVRNDCSWKNAGCGRVPLAAVMDLQMCPKGGRARPASCRSPNRAVITT